MSKYALLVLSGLLSLILLSCQPTPETMTTYYFRGLAVVSYPEDWYISEGMDIVAFSPEPFELDGTAPRIQFVVSDASVSGYFQADFQGDFNPINETNLYYFITTMGLNAQDAVSSLEIDGRQAFRLPFRGESQTEWENMRGWAVIIGEVNKPVLVFVIGRPGSLSKYEDTLEEMLMQLSFD